jgi:hypothetical protein
MTLNSLLPTTLCWTLPLARLVMVMSMYMSPFSWSHYDNRAGDNMLDCLLHL